MSRLTFPFIFVLALCLSFAACPPAPTTVQVPNVYNLTQSAASSAIVAAQLSVGNITTQASNTVAAGRVIGQSPQAGTSVARNSAVNLVISTGSGNVSVPSVTGMTQANASTTVTAAQLVVGTVTQEASNTVAAGLVISQNPAAGASVAAGTSVALVISTGPAAPSVAWSYDADNSIIGTSIDLTTDGGYIVGGGNTGYNMYALKLNANGQKVWDQTYSRMTTVGSPGELWRHNATGIRATDDGGYVLLGKGHIEFDELPGSSYLLLKVDSLGEEVWSQAYAPVNPYDNLDHVCVENIGRALQVTGDGGFVAFGDSYVGQYQLASIIKTDESGTADFLEVINDNAKAYDQHIVSGQQTEDGGYVLAGYSSNGSPAGYLAVLIKLDSTGALEWSRTYNYPAQDHGAEAFAVTQTADGGYILGGDLVNYINNNKTLGFGCWIAKVTETGEEVWSRSYANANTLRYPNAILETPQGDFVATGSISGHLVLSKFNAAGDLLWDFEMTDLAGDGKAMVFTADGGCAIVGSGGSGGAVVVKVNNVFIPE